MTNSSAAKKFQIQATSDNCVELHLVGDWVIGSTLPNIDKVKQALHLHQNISQVTLNSTALGKWDSRLVSFILRLSDHLTKENATFDITTLPKGVLSLIRLATTVSTRTDTNKTDSPPSFIERLGQKTIDSATEVKKFTTFIGEV